jgi:hypothetical protein
VLKSRKLKWAGDVARMEEGRSDFNILINKPTGRRPLGSRRSKWENNIRVDPNGIGIKTRFGSGKGLLERCCEWGIDLWVP